MSDSGHEVAGLLVPLSAWRTRSVLALKLTRLRETTQ